MSSNRPKSKPKKPGTQTLPKGKQNDTIFLLENQNQILKLKTDEINLKIITLQKQLKNYTENLHREELDCQQLRNQIKQTEFSDDMRLERQKHALEDKIAFLRGNQDILMDKIAKVRESTVLEESKIPQIGEDRKKLQRELWEQKTESQGLKVVLTDIQTDLEKTKNQNQILLSHKKVAYGPQEKQVTDEIEERIRIMKNTKSKTDNLRKKQGGQILCLFLNSYYFKKEKQALIMVERTALQRKIMQKRIFLLSLIRRKYLDTIKSATLQKFRSKFRPLTQQQQFENILGNTIKRRIKNKLFRAWRSEAIKQQFNKTRYFQVQNTLETLSQSLSTCNLFSAFNTIKYYKKNLIEHRHVENIYTIMDRGLRRSLNSFISSLISTHNRKLINDEVQASANQHSILMMQSIFFSAWAKLTKQNKVSNRIIKFRYFRELKKLLKIKKKRQLSQMLILTHEKIKEIDLASISFCHMKKQKTTGLLQQLQEDLQILSTKNSDISQQTQKFLQNAKELHHSLALFKIAKHLKGKVNQAFTAWRAENRKINKMILIANMLSSKMISWMNFGFAKIQRRRFEKLKLSIADKIESCEFSYNYLLKENRHIKDVLDNKLLELEKSKFVNILHRLIRNEKQIKHKYFYKFMHSGFKCWRFKKFYQRADVIIEHRTKLASFFMFKYIAHQKRREEFVENQTMKRLQKIQKRYLSLGFGALENVRNKNKKTKKILENIFNRNMELNVYNGYGEIKRMYSTWKEVEIGKVNQNVLETIAKTNKQTKVEEDTIKMLQERLDDKSQSIFMRKVLACRKFYLKNYTEKTLHFWNKWRNKVAYESKIKKFAGILQRKTRILIKNKFVLNFFRNEKEKEYQELNKRLQTFKSQLQQDIKDFEKYSSESEAQLTQMQEDNKTHDQVARELEKKTERMDNIKIQSFRRYWGKVMCSFVIRDWKQQKVQFIHGWRNAFEAVRVAALRHYFQILSEQMKDEILRNRLKTNLSKAYSKKFRYNARLAFNIWRLTNLNKKIIEYQNDYNDEVSLYKMITKKYELMTQRYNGQVNYRIGDRKLRKIFDFMKKYTRLKLENNRKKKMLEIWLKRGYQAEFYRLYTNYLIPLVQKSRRAKNYLQQRPIQQMQKIFYSWKTDYSRKKTIKRLFIDKFIHYSMFLINEQFFTKTKNYHRYLQIEDLNDRTFRIQKVIQTFEKKRKKIIGDNIRKWRKNQFEINIGKNLFKRLTRKSFYNRYEGLFYAWKLEAEARKVLAYNKEEGEIKKRKVEIQRLQNFLQQMKKKKGLLLQNEEGNFVMSPRFQKKKEEEDKREKNLRYKFVSRLILSINGYSTPIRAYNNMQMYMKLRQRYREKATFVLNHLRKPDLLLAFRTWRKASTQFREMFDTMERKDLIKILNKQKDKMEMQYSRKLSVDDNIKFQLERYRVFAHQRQQKEKICGYVLMKYANRVKQNAFRSWRERANDLKEEQLYRLGHKGQHKIAALEQELNQLEMIQHEFIQTNNFLKEAVSDALSIAEMVKKITEERDQLSILIDEKKVNCQSLLKQNQVLNSRLHLAQKQAMNLLIVSGEKP